MRLLLSGTPWFATNAHACVCFVFVRRFLHQHNAFLNYSGPSPNYIVKFQCYCKWLIKNEF